jgi:7-cyano-7-deazaguanine synthase
MRKAVVIVSGGMDSVTLAHQAAADGLGLSFLSFDYGQRHRKELDCAAAQAHILGAPHRIVDLTSLAAVLAGSALTGDQPVPHGHYSAETMKQTVVPNRNAIMLSIAWGHAVSIGAELVAAGVHAGDHAIYPDCRPTFAQALQHALALGTEGFAHRGLCIWTPFIDKTKTDIAAIGHQLGVDFSQTWTCYEGGDIHCGQCGACVERQEAFRDSGTPDPTVYRQPVGVPA